MASIHPATKKGYFMKTTYALKGLSLLSATGFILAACGGEGGGGDRLPRQNIDIDPTRITFVYPAEGSTITNPETGVCMFSGYRIAISKEDDTCDAYTDVNQYMSLYRDGDFANPIPLSNGVVFDYADRCEVYFKPDFSQGQRLAPDTLYLLAKERSPSGALTSANNAVAFQTIESYEANQTCGSSRFNLQTVAGAGSQLYSYSGVENFDDEGNWEPNFDDIWTSAQQVMGNNITCLITGFNCPTWNSSASLRFTANASVDTWSLPGSVEIYGPVAGSGTTGTVDLQSCSGVASGDCVSIGNSSQEIIVRRPSGMLAGVYIVFMKATLVSAAGQNLETSKFTVVRIP
jgi:hypothetical protein